MKAHFYWYSKDLLSLVPPWIEMSIKSFKKFHPEIPTVLHSNLPTPNFKTVDEFIADDVPPCPHEKGWVFIQNSVDYKKLYDAYHIGEGIFLDTDITFCRRLPEEFLKPDHKATTINIYGNYHPSFCLASFSVGTKNNPFFKEYMEWYGKDYNTVDYNWNANFVGGLISNYYKDMVKQLDPYILYDNVPIQLDWSFADYYNAEEKQHVCGVHWGTGIVRDNYEKTKKIVNAWNEAEKFIETGKFYPKHYKIQKAKWHNQLHVYCNTISIRIMRYILKAKDIHKNVVVHSHEYFEEFDHDGVLFTMDMNKTVNQKTYGGIHLLEEEIFS